MQTSTFSWPGRGRLFQICMLIALFGIGFFPGTILAQVDISDIFFREVAKSQGTTADHNEGFQARSFDHQMIPVDIKFESANRELNINLPPEVMLQEIHLMDLSGNQYRLPMANVQSYKRSLIELPSGYYVLRVKSSAGWTRKNICLL